MTCLDHDIPSTMEELRELIDLCLVSGNLHSRSLECFVRRVLHWPWENSFTDFLGSSRILVRIMRVRHRREVYR
jgi:hypothetical protein